MIKYLSAAAALLTLCACGRSDGERHAEAAVYKMGVTYAPAPAAAGRPAKFLFAPAKTGGGRAELEPVNGKPIHLIAVSDDLGWFAHEHPVQDGAGGYALALTFPAGGPYTLFADFQPAGGGHMTEKFRLQVSGKPAPAAVFSGTRGKASAGGYEVTLEPEGGRYLAGAPARIKGVLRKNGREIDVGTLEDYLEAKAHMVIVGLRDKDYLHVHPGVSGGRLDLHTRFGAPGLYRGWLQFMAEGELRTVDFVFDVAEGGPAGTAHDAHGEGHGH